jgi:hypothetical protein
MREMKHGWRPWGARSGHPGRWGRWGKYGPLFQLSDVQALLLGVLVLFGWGAYDAVATYRLYFHGEQRHAAIDCCAGHCDTTCLRIEGVVCAVEGHYGSRGQPVVVAYRRGDPLHCIVRTPEAFRWSLGAMLGSVVVLAVYLVMRAGSL